MTEEYCRIVRFLIVGGFNTLFGYSIYAAALYLSGSSLVAVTVATLIGVLFNYFSYGSVVFRMHGGASFPRFLLLFSLIWLINSLLLIVLETYGASPLLAQLFFIPITATMSYVGMRRVVFCGLPGPTLETGAVSASVYRTTR